MEEIISEGNSVSEAVDKALATKGLRRDQVEVQILQEASSGFLGMGAKLAKVRISEKLWSTGEGKDASQATATAVKTETAPRKTQPAHETAKPQGDPIPSGSRTPLTTEQAEEACKAAGESVKETIRLMQIEVTSLNTSWDMEQERIKVEVETPEAERLIGKEGRTLEALQFLTTLIVSRRFKIPTAVWVDTQGYWDRKEKAILAQAQEGIDEVKSTGKPYRMPPMDPAMRRLVHRSLAGNPDIQTISEGEGSWRKIVLKPRK